MGALSLQGGKITTAICLDSRQMAVTTLKTSREAQLIVKELQ